jgi:hypothetical protein
VRKAWLIPQTSCGALLAKGWKGQLRNRSSVGVARSGSKPHRARTAVARVSARSALRRPGRVRSRSVAPSWAPR